MGLFSSSNKNKQDRAAEDSGRFYSKDDDAALGERARAKRASNAGGDAVRNTRRAGNDPMLPEKKRARRRLVGAIALALAAAVGLPMLLDSEPKPLAGDIAIQIPSKDKAAPLPVPGEKAADAVAAEESVDKDEEVVPATSVAAPPVAKVELPKTEAKHETRAEPKVEPAPDHEAEDAKLAERRLAERREREKAEKAEKEKAAERLAERHRADRERADKERAEKERAEKERADRLAKAKAEEKARAVAILEGKQPEKDKEKDKDKDKPAESASQRFVLQVAALSSQEKAAEVQARLREAGISSYTQKTTTPSGELIRVRVGPLSREDAEKVRAKLGKLGMSGAMTPV